MISSIGSATGKFCILSYLELFLLELVLMYYELVYFIIGGAADVIIMGYFTVDLKLSLRSIFMADCWKFILRIDEGLGGSC